MVFISKEEMVTKFGEDYFGYSIPNVGVWVREDLPDSVKTSVTAHEMYHYNDTTFYQSSAFMRELKANIAGFKSTPIGFFYGILLSLSPSRISLYICRIVKGF